MTKLLKNIKRHVKVLKGFPDVIAIEPTNYCNLHCPLCPAHHDYLDDSVRFGYMDFGNFKGLIDQIKGFIYHVSLSFRGEPLLHKNIIDMIKYCTDSGVFSFMNTNGTLLTDRIIEGIFDSGLGRINIALDGLTPETYIKYRVGGDFHKVYSGIKKITQMKRKLGSKKPEIIVQFLILEHNKHEVARLPDLQKSLGIDKISINRASVPAWLVDRPEIARDLCEHYIPQNDDSRYVNGDIQVPNKRCGAYKRLAVTWNGDACVCNFDNNAKYTFGNLFEGKTFNEIWFSDKNRAWRKLIKRKELEICTNCGQSLAYKATYLK
jgi:radical SAM protein with 4Fe4S-binding SPASM domain